MGVESKNFPKAIGSTVLSGGSAVVITSAVVRAFLNAVLLVAKPSSDLKVCKSVRLAVQHLGWVVPARSG